MASFGNRWRTAATAVATVLSGASASAKWPAWEVWRRGLLAGTALVAVAALMPARAADDFLPVPADLQRSYFSADLSVMAGSGGNHAWRWENGVLVDITPLGALEGQVRALSADGRVAVGKVRTGGVEQAYRWVGTAPLALGFLPGAYKSQANGVSADGTVVVGKSLYPSGGSWQAFRWENGAMTGLAGLGGDSQANAVSANGLVTVGASTPGTPDAREHAVRWVGTGAPEDLGVLPGGTTSSAELVSTDGAVVVGSASVMGIFNHHVFRWRGGQLTDLGTLGGLVSSAYAISADGAVVVGEARDASDHERAAMWTDGPAVDLGTFGGDSGVAFDVTADGTIVVGAATDAGNNLHAFQWTEAGGLRSIEELLTAAGVDLTGWSLTSAEAISDDGKRLAGRGTDSLSIDGWWFSNCDAACAVISREIVAQSFAGLGALGHTGSAYLGSELKAAGDMASAGQGAPLTGFAYGAFDSDPTTSASVGATYGFGDDLVIGGSLGVAGILTPMPFDGSATFSGPSVTAFAASKPDAGFNWLVGGSLAGLTGTITRGYLNGSTPAISSGSTTGGGAALSAEAGFTFAGLLADTLVTPFVNVTVSSVSYAGYTETGGPFPASFSALTSTSAILRVGVDGRYEFEKGAYLSAGLSYGHNFGDAGTVVGAIPGVFATPVLGNSAARDFVEASVGLELPVKDNIRFNSRLAVIVPFTGTASIQARAGITMTF